MRHRKPPSRSRRSKADTAPTGADAPTGAPASTTPAARAATEEELAAIARAQQGHQSAEGFWKAAGRFTKLR